MAHRSFTDSHGRVWDVWTVQPTRVERRRLTPTESIPAFERRERQESRALLDPQWKNGWLAFETKGEKRRLAPFPDDWIEMSPGQLEKLCEAATPAAAPRRLIE
jgi:hypothetical protein